MSTQTEIEFSYGLDNDFFSLWLDRRMNYTCALFQDPEDDTESLEEAQDRKLARLSRLAGIGPDTRRVLDIGCGWGANLEYQLTVNGVPEAHGITLSERQAEYCRLRGHAGLTVECVADHDYQPVARFDAAMSICMMEHVARPEDMWRGRHLDRYRAYFQRVHSWTRPGSHFGLQVITRAKAPRDRQGLDDIRHANSVFPGGICPRPEEVLTTVDPWFEVLEMHSMRRHYRQTSRQWLERLQAHEGDIRARWGDEVYQDYERYLQVCVKCFDRHWQSLHQFSLRRRDV